MMREPTGQGVSALQRTLRAAAMVRSSRGKNEPLPFSASTRELSAGVSSRAMQRRAHAGNGPQTLQFNSGHSSLVHAFAHCKLHACVAQVVMKRLHGTC